MTYDEPLKGITVLDFSQFLAGPVAALRLADLGATVIKIERPGVGDIGRTLAFAGLRAGSDTVSFHAMNRGKQSLVADMKLPEDREFIYDLIRKADVVIENFRPGVTSRLGLDYDSVKSLNDRIIYGTITGYGTESPWRGRPGQDLLAQSLAGLPWIQNTETPKAVGLSVADHLASCHLAQGIVALLFRRERTGQGGRVETSLLESLVDLQFEMISTKLTAPAGVHPAPVGQHSAHGYLPAPYGIYPTDDGYISLAMNSVVQIGELLEIGELQELTDPQSWWDERVRIEDLIAERLMQRSTAAWLEILDAADVWCAPVLTIDELIADDAFKAIDMVQEVSRIDNAGEKISVHTTRTPLRIDGERPTSLSAAPLLGEHTAQIREIQMRNTPPTAAI